MYNTTLFLSHHLSFASLIFPLFSPYRAMIFLSTVKYYEKYRSHVSVRRSYFRMTRIKYMYIYFALNKSKVCASLKFFPTIRHPFIDDDPSNNVIL